MNILDLHLCAICFLALLEIQLILGVAVADDVVSVGTDEVRHAGGLRRFFVCVCVDRGSWVS